MAVGNSILRVWCVTRLVVMVIRWVISADLYGRI